MRHLFLVTLSLAMVLVVVASTAAEAKNAKHFGKQFSKNWKGGQGNANWLGGRGLGGRGNNMAVTGHPVFGYNHPAHGAFHPAFGVTGKKSVAGNIGRIFRRF